ncbi:MAG: 1,2-diacylglycerol 3-beta-glucosyltransferase [Pseudohongiellaceae bacterium]|jgi:1,2-diacylglycerol 3-beta-glucosyltransferase
MSAALAAVHMLRPVARRRLGLSVGLKGDGMCFSREIIERCGWPAHSIVEDAEFTLTLWEHKLKVEFAREATVSAQMPAGSEEFATLRSRWEGGRAALVAQACRRFLPQVMGQRDMVAFDLLAELAIPPLIQLVALTVMLIGAAGGLAAAGLMPWWPCVLAVVAMTLQVGYVVGALRLV